MRYLAIDLGGKRTGLAMGSDAVSIVSPLDVVRGSDDASRLLGIEKAIHEHGPDALVLGLPLNMDDSEGPAAVKTRVFAELLRKRFKLEVHMVDERLSSFEADEALAGRTWAERRKTAGQDAIAAKLILERFLAEQQTGAGDRD